ncbi:hypothetical protein LXA43DRAFT_906394, partial [Ganoderma leucocontextum]
MRAPPLWPFPPAAHTPDFAALCKVYTPLRPVGFNTAGAVRNRADAVGVPPLTDLLWDNPTPQSASALEIKHRNLLRVLAVPPGGNLWGVLRSFLGAKPRPTYVTTTQLRATFETRMNPPRVLPPEFNPLRHALNRVTAHSLPRRTLDTSEGSFFSKPFTVEEVDAVKSHIRAH